MVLPLARGSGLRGAEEVEGVAGQWAGRPQAREDRGDITAGCLWCFCTPGALSQTVQAVFFARDRTKAWNNGCNHDSGSCLRCFLSFGIPLNLCRVSFSSSGLWSYLCEYLNVSLSLTGWLCGEPWWPGSGVFSVLRYLPQWRVWKDGGATETQSSARCRDGKQSSVLFLSAFQKNPTS